MITDDNPIDVRLAEYALNTLEPAGIAEVEALLERSEEARAELRTLREALVGLTEALPPVQPPAHVWERLQERLEPTESTVPAPPVRILPRGRTWQGYLGWALAACLSLLALGEALWLETSRSAYREAEREAVLVAEFLASPETEKRLLYGRAREGLGSVLTRSGGDALFVLAEPPDPNKVYQAWGHTNDEWEPGSDARLTSLGVSEDPIFEVATQNFAALYLSLEPAGGSSQPTFALSRVSLTEPIATTPLSVSSPADGSVIRGASVIVSGTVDGTITRLSYLLNGEESVTTTSGTRFSFTVALQRGVNRLTIRAEGPQGVTQETLELTRP